MEQYIVGIVPTLSFLVSLVVSYSNWRHHSIDLAMKYHNYSKEIIRSGCSSETCAMDQALSHEAHLASGYYAWKSLSHPTDHKKSYFNYASFLVYVSGWVGMAVGPASKSVSDTGILNPVYPVGFVAIVLAVALMSYTRYESALYGKYLTLIDQGKHQPSCVAVHQAVGKVVDESIAPILVSFLACLVLGHVLDPQRLQLLWTLLIMIIGVVDNIQTLKKGSEQ